MISPRPADNRSNPGAGGAGNGDTPSWPVLARIPTLPGGSLGGGAIHATPSGQTPASSSWFDANRYVPLEPSGVDALLPLVDALEIDAPLMPPLEELAPRATARRPTRITEQAAVPTRRLAQQQRRVDQVVASLSPFERTAVRPTPQPVVAGAAYRAYARLAPHAAVLVMAVLILAAGLLYLIAFGKSERETPILFDAPTRTSIEATGSSVAPATMKPQPADPPREIRVAHIPDRSAAAPPPKLPPLVDEAPASTAPVVGYPRTLTPEFPEYVAKQRSVQEQR